MARQRMYLFERAYVDYGARLRNAGRSLRSGAGRVWAWFWKGPGANAIEWLLRLGVVASGVAVGVMYVMYERHHGRGFGVGMAFVFCIIAVYVSVLMWGWKVPVHFVARLIAAAGASAATAAVVAVAIAIAAAVFCLYILVLFSLTLISFLVFLPMRFAQEIWLLYRRVSYRCPYDDCPHRGLPIHVCSCGQQYPDLLPSFYGIFYHRCRHGDKDTKLPTMDFLGRNRLVRLCGGCKRPLLFSSFGELGEKPIVVIGGPSSGKSVFLRQAIRQLCDRWGSLPGARIGVDSEEQRRDLSCDLALLDRGQLLPKTVGSVVHACGLAVRVPGRMRALLYLFDCPGEHFASIEQFARKQVIQHLAGIIVMVDPFSFPALSVYARSLHHQVSPSESSLERDVTVMIQGVNQMLVQRPTDRCSVPVAVVLTKADGLPIDDLPFLAGLCPDGQQVPGDALSARCRDALVRLGQDNPVRLLEQKFPNLRYFACSALGRLPDERDDSSFRPVGVAEPLLWLLRPADRTETATAPKALPASAATNP